MAIITDGSTASELAIRVVGNAAQPATDGAIIILAQRDDSLSALSDPEGDYIGLRVNSQGALHVTGGGGGTEFAVGSPAGGTDAGRVILAVRDDTLSTLADPEGDYVRLRVNSQGALHVTGGGGGTEYTVNDAAPANPTGSTIVFERDDALSALTEVEGDWTNPRANARGALWVELDPTNAVAVSHATLAVTGGGVEAGALRVTLANDSTGVLSIDDNSGSITVDGTVIVNAGTGDFLSIAAHTTNEGLKEAMAIGGQFDDTGTTVATENNVAPVRITAQRALHSNLRKEDGTEIASGGGTEANALRVTMASDSTGLVSIDAPGGISVDDGGGVLSIDWNGTPPPIGPGTEAAALRVTLATNSTGLISVDDGAGSLTVDNAGTFAVQVDAALPAGTNNIGDVDVLTLPALPAGTNNIGDVDVLTLPSIPAGTNNIGDVDIVSLPNEGQQSMANSISVAIASDQSLIEVSGDVAHDVAIAGNPVPIAFRANLNEPGTQVGDADSTYAWGDRFGRLVTIDSHPNPEAPDCQNVTASGNTSIIGVPGAGVSIHVKKASLHNGGASGIDVRLEDGAGGSVGWRGHLAADGGGVRLDWGSRGWKLTANTLLNANLGAAGDVDINILEYYLSA